jgi:hypothetical protein
MTLAIGTLVERTSRFTMLPHLPPMEGHGTIEPTKNRPPLAGHDAEAVRDAIAASFSSLPKPTAPNDPGPSGGGSQVVSRASPGEQPGSGGIGGGV